MQRYPYWRRCTVLLKAAKMTGRSMSGRVRGQRVKERTVGKSPDPRVMAGAD